MAALLRLIVLGSSALLCGLTAGLVALYVQGKTLPPSDGAYGMSLVDTLRDPFVPMIMGPMIAIGAGIGFAFSAWTLRRVKLTRAIPAVFVVTIATAAVSGPLGMMSAFPALFAGVGTMLWFRAKARRDIRYAVESPSS